MGTHTRHPGAVAVATLSGAGGASLVQRCSKDSPFDEKSQSRIPDLIARHFPEAELSGEARSIPLASGRSFLVDADIADDFMRHPWHEAGSRGAYPARKVQLPDGTWSTLYAHRIVTDAKPGSIIDHANGDTRDCRRSNLRAVTPSENAINARPAKGRRFTGIVQGAPGRWRAVCRKGGRVYRGQWRGSQEEAARDRDAIMREVWGTEFPRFHFPLPGERGLDGIVREGRANV